MRYSALSSPNISKYALEKLLDKKTENISKYFGLFFVSKPTADNVRFVFSQLSRESDVINFLYSLERRVRRNSDTREMLSNILSVKNFNHFSTSFVGFYDRKRPLSRGEKENLFHGVKSGINKDLLRSILLTQDISQFSDTEKELLKGHFWKCSHDEYDGSSSCSLSNFNGSEFE